MKDVSHRSTLTALLRKNAHVHFSHVVAEFIHKSALSAIRSQAAATCPMKASIFRCRRVRHELFFNEEWGPVSAAHMMQGNTH